MKKGIIMGVMGVVAGSLSTTILKNKTIKDKKEKIDKFKNYYSILNQWLILKQDGKSLGKYFEKNNYNTVAIYGMGEMGNRLYDELKGTNTKVIYAIDKEAATVYSAIEIYELSDELPNADVVVVTATFAFEEIYEQLRKVTDMRIVSLEDVIYEAD